MFIQPMLVSSGPLPVDSDRYAFEVKWDGYRALVHASAGGVNVMSRNGNLLTSRYPELHGLGHHVDDRVATRAPHFRVAVDAEFVGGELVLERPDSALSGETRMRPVVCNA